MMINFVDRGSDEALLKSLPAEDAPEDMVKAMNRQGLVQKEIQVRGKNGQMYTRKQWCRAAEAQPSPRTKGSGGGGDDGNGKSNMKYHNSPDGLYTAKGQKQAHDKANEIAQKFGNGAKVEKLGDYGFVFKADYKTACKVRDAFNMEETFNDVENGGGFDFNKLDIKFDGHPGSIFCNEGGFQGQSGVLIGVSYNPES